MPRSAFPRRARTEIRSGGAGSVKLGAGPAALEASQGPSRSGARGHGEDHEGQPGIGRQRRRLHEHLHITHHRVVQPQDARALVHDVMGLPQPPEVPASRAQLHDQFAQGVVVGNAPGLGVQRGHDVTGHLLPVRVEGARPLIQEDEAGDVRTGRLDAAFLSGPRGFSMGPVMGRVQAAPQLVGPQQVEPPVADEGRSALDRVEQVVQARPQFLRSGPSLDRRIGRGAADQAPQVGLLDVVELQDIADGIEHGVRDAAGTAPLQAGVVLHAHLGEHGDLLTAQARDPAVAAGRGETSGLGRDAGAPRAQEVAQLGSGVHRSTIGLRPAAVWRGAPPVPPLSRACRSCAHAGAMEP